MGLLVPLAALVSGAGRRLAGRWRLPQRLSNVLWLHHQPLDALPVEGEQRALIGMVQLAHAIAQQAGFGWRGADGSATSQTQLAEALGLSADVVVDVRQRLSGLFEGATARSGVDFGAACSMERRFSTAARGLSRLARRLQGRLAAAARRSQAFERLRDFTDQLAADSTIAEVLSRLVSTFASAGGIAAGRAEPIIAYAVGVEADLAFAVRLDGDGKYAWRAVRRCAVHDASLQPWQTRSAEQAAAAVFEDPHDLSDWTNLAGYFHQPLVGQGRWVGGIMFPAHAAPSDAESRRLMSQLADVMGGILATVLDRFRTLLLCEGLAGASQKLAQAQQSVVEDRTQQTIGELAAGAAHELNNPLAVVSGRAQMMAQKATDEQQRKVWQLIAEQSQRASDIVTELMDLASPQPPSPEIIDVRELLEQAVEAFKRSDHPQAGSAEVDIQISEPLPAIRADRRQIVSVLCELLTNAATAAGDEALISLAACEVNGSVRITVADNGPGMDAQTLSHAFTPFYSSQPAGRRRGLGLPRARRYVQNNGGRMKLESSPGRGTVVTVQLPAAGVD